MKKVSLMIMMILCVCGSLQAGWERIYNDTLAFNNGYFRDSLNGWGIHIYGGHLYYSNDGGITWNEQNAPILSNGIIDIKFSDKNTGFIAGLSARNTVSIFRGNGDVTNWENVFEKHNYLLPEEIPTSRVVGKLLFPTQTTGYFFCLAGSSSIYMAKTVDGGNTWADTSFKILAGASNMLEFDVSFIDTNTGWLVGSFVLSSNSSYYGAVYKTEDGGYTWELLADRCYNIGNSNNNNNFVGLTSVFFINDKKGWVGSERVNYTQGICIIARTEDGGKTWEKQSIDTQNVTGTMVRDIYFVNDTLGWALTMSDLFVTRNGGVLWSRFFTEPDDLVLYDRIQTQRFRKLSFADANNGWIIGNQLIYRTTDNGGYPQQVSVIPNLRSKSQSLQPFNIKWSFASKGMTNINYRLDKDVSLSLSIYNLRGRKIISQPQRFQVAGEHKFSVKIPKGFYVVETKIYNGSKVTKYNEKILVR